MEDCGRRLVKLNQLITKKSASRPSKIPCTFCVFANTSQGRSLCTILSSMYKSLPIKLAVMAFHISLALLVHRLSVLGGIPLFWSDSRCDTSNVLSVSLWYDGIMNSVCIAAGCTSCRTETAGDSWFPTSMDMRSHLSGHQSLSSSHLKSNWLLIKAPSVPSASLQLWHYGGMGVWPVTPKFMCMVILYQL